MELDLFQAVSLSGWAQFAVTGIVTGSIYALVALGFNAVFNATDVVNFAQGEFVMLGGLLSYTGSELLGLPVAAAVVLAVLAVAVIGGLLQLLVVQPAKQATVLGLTLATVAAALFATAMARAAWGVNALNVPAFMPGEAIRTGGVVITAQSIWVVAAALIAMLAMREFQRRSTTGLAMQAVALNRPAAEAVGISVSKMVLLAFVLAGALGGLGGVLLAPITGAAYGIGLGLTIVGFTAAVLGGLGSISGAVVGGLALGMIEALSAGVISSAWQQVVPMALLILILMVRPTGILGTGALSRA